MGVLGRVAGRGGFPRNPLTQVLKDLKILGVRRKYIGIEAARKILGDLALEAQQGTEIVLTRGNSRTPTARIAPLEAPMTAPYTLISANTGDLVPGVELSDPDCPLAWDDLPEDAQEWAEAQGYDGEDDSELLYVLMDDDEDEGVPAGFPAYRVAPDTPDSLDRDLVVAIVAGPHRDVLDFAATGIPLPSVETDELWEWIAEHEADGTNDDRWVALSFGFVDGAIAARTVRLTEEEAALLHAEVERDEAERADD